ncbi:MAG TPA: hypothetical protein VIV82_07340 [Verrucomicrobiae bacterium]
MKQNFSLSVKNNFEAAANIHLLKRGIFRAAIVRLQNELRTPVNVIVISCCFQSLLRKLTIFLNLCDYDPENQTASSKDFQISKCRGTFEAARFADSAGAVFSIYFNAAAFRFHSVGAGIEQRLHKHVSTRTR